MACSSALIHAVRHQRVFSLARTATCMRGSKNKSNNPPSLAKSRARGLTQCRALRPSNFRNYRVLEIGRRHPLVATTAECTVLVAFIGNPAHPAARWWSFSLSPVLAMAPLKF